MDPKSGGQKWTPKVAAKSGGQKWRPNFFILFFLKINHATCPKCIGPTIRIGRDILCLPYAGFFFRKKKTIGILYSLLNISPSVKHSYLGSITKSMKNYGLKIFQLPGDRSCLLFACQDGRNTTSHCL